MNTFIELPNNNGRFISQVLNHNVKTTPVAIGQYRTYIKDEGALTCTDDTPTTLPNPNNGMLIFSANYPDAGVVGEPNRWEIYIGLNKRFQAEYYLGPNRASLVENQPYVTINAGPSFDFVGCMTAYNPVVGVIIIDTVFQTEGITNRYAGNSFPPDGSDPAYLTSCYFDILVF